MYRTKALKDKKTFTVTAQLTKPSQTVQVCIASVRPRFVSCVSCILFIVFCVQENIAGVSVTKLYRPKIASRQFPVMDTRPRNAVVCRGQGS